MVIAANEMAHRLGVERGTTRRAAEALSPTAVVLERDRAAEARRFEPLVALVESYVPRVEVVDPGLVLVAIEGAIRFYGDETTLVTLLEKEVDRREGPTCRIGVASTSFAARIAAALAEGSPVYVDDDRRFLASRDLGVLPNRDLVDTFRWLGFGTLGDLASLPREVIASRFGQAGIDAHRLASGESLPPAPRTIPADLVVEESFEDPLDSLERVAFIARALGIRLMGILRQVGVAPRSIEVEVESAGGEKRTRTWLGSDPLTEEAVIERVSWQVRGWVESPHRPVGGVVRIRITPLEVSGGGRQLGLLEDTPAILDAERTITRLRAIAGPDRVLTARPQGGRDPLERVRWQAWGEDPGPVDRDPAAPWPGRTPGPAPALVPPDPVPFTIDWDGGIPVRVRLRSRWVEVLTWAGPWRSTGRWWRAEGDADRYQLVTSAGAFLCEVTSEGAFLVGVYD